MSSCQKKPKGGSVGRCAAEATVVQSLALTAEGGWWWQSVDVGGGGGGGGGGDGYAGFAEKHPGVDHIAGHNADRNAGWYDGVETCV
jgi:hypothetical protein